MKDYKSILRERIYSIPKDYRLVSEHYEDCLQVFIDVLAEAMEDIRIETCQKDPSGLAQYPSPPPQAASNKKPRKSS